MAQLMPLPLTVSCSSKIQIGFTFLVPAYPGCPGKEAVKWLYVCCKRPGVYFGPLLGGTGAHILLFFRGDGSAHFVIFFCFRFLRNSRNRRFSAKIHNFFCGSGPRYSCRNFIPDGPWGSPCSALQKLAPAPKNL